MANTAIARGNYKFLNKFVCYILSFYPKVLYSNVIPNFLIQLFGILYKVHFPWL